MLRHSLLPNSFRTIKVKGVIGVVGTKLSSPRRYIASGLSAFAAFVRRLIAFSRLFALGSVDEDNGSSCEEYCRKDNDLIKSRNFLSRRRKIDDEVVSERA